MRKVRFRCVLPPEYKVFQSNFPVLLMNDGQDFTQLQLEKILSRKFADKHIAPFIYVGIEASEHRMKEYGIASSADYKGRGNKAKDYSKFILEEFIPFLKNEFKVSDSAEDWVYCGMSLGGLSAFDITYNHPEYFGKVGVFSGSFWWRKQPYVKNDLRDRSRIILDVIKDGTAAAHLRFWFQCGTEDETADRNKNGVIDAIDDTLDVIKELQLKGYSFPGDITYLELEGGKHDIPTWTRLFPDFIKWAFGSTISPEKSH